MKLLNPIKINRQIFPAIILVFIVFVQEPNSQESFRIHDIDGHVNMRIMPDKRSKAAIKIPSGECIIEGFRQGGWSKVLYAHGKRRYIGYVHESRMINDSTCRYSENEQKIDRCEIVNLKFNENGSFITLARWYHADYIKTCDDGEYAEQISDFITKRLANEWRHSINEIIADSKLVNYMDFIMQHIDATCDKENLVQIANSARKCVDVENEALCKEIFKAVNAVIEATEK